MSNTLVFQEEWATQLQDRLNKPTNWKEICEVVYTNTKVLHRPYSTDPAVQTGQTRGAVYNFQDITETDENVTIDEYDNLAEFIDKADEAQSQFSTQMYFADRQGRLIDERVETKSLANHAAWTNLGDDGSGNVTLNATTALAVSATNIDDIVRAVKREVQKANGWSIAKEKGIFIEWRAQDWEMLEQFGQANGFSVADAMLKNGAQIGMEYMGVYHYLSTSHTAGHVFAGVRKLQTIGIVKKTYGKITVKEDPAGPSGGNLSGWGIVSRLDSKVKAWHNTTPLLFDINVV